MSNKITILGAGPSGLTAALSLAQAGFRVQVHETENDVGARFKGDLQGMENWTLERDAVTELQSYGINCDFLMTPFDSLQLSNGKGMEPFKFGHPLFYVIKRGNEADCLDRSLKEQVLKAGVELHFNSRLAPEKADIIATGPRKRNLLAVAHGIVFKTDAPDIALGIVNDQLACKGYAYLLITGGQACLCITMFDKLGSVQEHFKRARDTIENLVPFNVREEVQVGGYVNFARECNFMENGNMLTGEAAGLQDCLWGFGVRQAIRSGYEAAHSLIHNLNYDQHARSQFEPRIKAGIVNRYLWEAFGTRTFPFIRWSAGNAMQAKKKLYSYYTFNTMQKFLYPLAVMKMKQRYPELAPQKVRL